MPSLALRLLKSRIAWFVAVAGVVLPGVFWYWAAHANRNLPEMAAQSGDDGPDLQQPPPDVRIDYDARRLVRQPIRKVAGLFLVQVTEAPGGKGASFLFDRQGRLRHRLDREVVDGRAFGEDCVLLTSRDVVRLGPDDRPTWTAPFRDREWLAGGGIVDLPGGDLLAFLYGEISDSGVRVMRVRPDDGTVVWQAFCSPLGVSHSAYSHQATVAVEDGQVKVVSRASGGEFVEFLDVQSGRQLRRSQNKDD